MSHKMDNLQSVQDNFQCAEIFCSNQDNFTIKCKVCEEKVKDFQRFLLHFQDKHANIARAVRSGIQVEIENHDESDDLKYLDMDKTNIKTAQVFCKENGAIVIVCVICGALMKRFDDAKQHIKAHFGTGIHNDADTLMNLKYCEVLDPKILKNEQNSATAKQKEIVDKLKDASKTTKIYTCDVCGKSLLSAIRLKYHKNTHKLDKLLSIKAKKLEHHNKMHEINISNGSSETNNCNANKEAVFASAEKNKFICPVCEKVFSSELELEFHKELHVAINMKSLLIENNLVTSKLNNYQIAAELATSYQKYERIKSLAEHIFTTAKPLKQYKKQTNPLAEPGCTGVNTEPVSSQECKGSLQAKNKLIITELSSSSQDDDPTKPLQENPKEVYVYKITASEQIKGSYCCEICGKLYETPRLLSMHMLFHTNNDNFKCDICNIAFKSSELLNRHFVLRHNFDCKYFCKLCLKIFESEEHLLTHTNTEHCKEANLPQTKSSSLARLTFTYFCEICRRNIERDELTGHIRYHEGEIASPRAQCKSNIATSQTTRDEDVIIITDE